MNELVDNRVVKHITKCHTGSMATSLNFIVFAKLTTKSLHGNYPQIKSVAKFFNNRCLTLVISKNCNCPVDWLVVRKNNDDLQCM